MLIGKVGRNSSAFSKVVRKGAIFAAPDREGTSY